MTAPSTLSPSPGAITEPPVSWLRYIALCIALGACAGAEWHIYYRYSWTIPNMVLVGGAIVAALLLGRPRPLAPQAPVYVEVDQSRRRWLSGAVLALAGLVVLARHVHLLSTQWEESFGLGWAGVVAGVALTSLGLSLLDRGYRKAVAPVRWRRWEMAIFLAILLLGLFLRFYRYGEFPPPDGVCAVEEPQSGQGAYLAMEGLRWWEFMLDRWLPVPIWMVFGRSLTTLRIPFTIVSWLTIIPLYLLLRELVSRPSALFATGLFAICRWHLIYARLAHAVFGPTLPLILTALYLCVRVHRRGGLAPYPWIGLLCGATLFAYAGYRGTTVFIALFFLVSLVSHLRAARRGQGENRSAAWLAIRTEVIGLLLIGVGVLSVAAPLYTRLANNPKFFVEAAVRATDDQVYYSDDVDVAWMMRQRRIRQTAMMFLHSGDSSGTFNLPGSPQLDPVAGTLFVVGLAYCVIFAAYRFQGYFAAYFLILLFMGTLFVHNFDIRRLQGIIPLIFILIAFTADRFRQVTLARFGRRARAALAGLALLLGGLALADNYDLYFRRMMNDPGVRSTFQNRYTIGYRYLLSLPEDAYLIALTSMTNFLAPNDFEWLWRTGPPGHSSDDLTALFRGEDGPWSGREVHILIHQQPFEAPQLAHLIEQRFPGARCGPFMHPDRPYPEYWACQLPRPLGGMPWSGGVTARYYRGDEAEPFLTRQQPVISYGFFPDECLVYKGNREPPCRAVYEGVWRIAEPGVHQLMVQAWKGSLTVALDGKILHRGRVQEPHFVIDDAMQRGLNLTAGDHRIRIEAVFNTLEAAGVRVQARAGGAGEWELLRFAQIASPAGAAVP